MRVPTLPSKYGSPLPMALIVPLPLRCHNCQTSRASIAISSAPDAPLAASLTVSLLGPSLSSSRILLHFFFSYSGTSCTAWSFDSIPYVDWCSFLWCDPAALMRLLARCLSRSRRFVKCDVLWSSLITISSEWLRIDAGFTISSVTACVRTWCCLSGSCRFGKYFGVHDFVLVWLRVDPASTI